MLEIAAARLLFATAAWAAIALIWIVLALGQGRGRSWHIGLALAPFPAFALALFGGDTLGQLASLWLVMGLAIFCAVAAAWVWGEIARNHGVMDIVYALSVLAAAGVGVAVVGADAWRLTLVALVAAWSLRLAAQTWGQNIGAERAPYSNWRKRFGPKWRWWSFFQVHLLQGVTIWLWCLGLAAAFSAPQPQSWWFAGLGAAVWGTGFCLQTLADQQLAVFKREPANRGKLLDQGVWKLVRHPNYLGEAIMWWGTFCFALAHPWGLLALASPVFATWFLGYASAAPFKEQHMARTRGAAWEAYCRRTPRFLPWPRAARET
ncbi:MAG: DUF1295 domain-containing protein [Hyphomonadaceae bacterium]